MLAALPQFLPQTLSSGQLLLILFIVACLDAAIAFGAVVFGILFVAFKAGKAVYDTIDKIVDWAIYTVFRMAEDALETPPLDKVPLLQLVLVGVKKAYDIINAGQKLIELAISLLVTALAAILVLACGLALAVINASALGAVIYYLR
jgi:hypothetical protein